MWTQGIGWLLLLLNPGLQPWVAIQGLRQGPKSLVVKVGLTQQRRQTWQLRLRALLRHPSLFH
jgi:hypothetical protein